MSSDPAAPPALSASPLSGEAGSRPSRGCVVVLAFVLVVAVFAAGTPELGAPWLLGDEFIFLVHNPEVNPAARPGAASVPLSTRLGAILTQVHEDLYQPVPMLTYALEWELSRGQAASFRRTDLLLHVLNAVLLWWVLRIVLRRSAPVGSLSATVAAWALALLWALHPVHVTTYAGDMGRTHLLSATFALMALGLHIRFFERRRWGYFVAAVAALLGAMLSKAIPGWVLVVLILEATWLGWRAALRSARLYVVAVLCVAFAALTMWTSAQSGIPEDASKGLFGDPAARSALAVWIYFRNLVAPFWLTFWYLPDPQTGWQHPLVWVGLGLALISLWHAVSAWRRAETRTITFGWSWCAGLLLPVIGLVGAREAAAVDRYLYQPLMGILLVIGVMAMRALASPSSRFKRPERLVLPIVGVLALLMLFCDLPYCGVVRSVVRRAKRVVQLNPGDPRALEALAAAYDFAQDHALLASDLEAVPAGVSQTQFFRRLWHEALTQAASAPNLAHYFPGPEDRGPFHRRLSYRFLRAGDAEQSLNQAQEARKLLPDEFGTWRRLAHAYQALGRWPDAVAAYQRCEQLLPDDPARRAVHYTDFANLLMFELERDAEACPRFYAALETPQPPLPAKIGVALCQIRYGEGARGFELIHEVLQADPGNIQAGLVLAEYHLRSHHWQEAAGLYDAVLRADPTQYTALRGFHEVCFHTNRLKDAALAWTDAARRAPERREFRSFLVWTLGLMHDDTAEQAARQLLEADPNNPFACFTLMLSAVRANDLDAAIEWVERARAGTSLPKGREFERAAAALQLLAARKELPREADIVQAALCVLGDLPVGRRQQALQLLDDYRASFPDSRWTPLVERLRDQLSDQPTAR